jgi:hypothetical protein
VEEFIAFDIMYNCSALMAVYLKGLIMTRHSRKRVESGG